MEQRTKFTYREFYDLPRMVIFNHRGLKLLLDCKFDDALDEYPSAYKVYILPPEINEGDEISWESMPSKAVKYVGEIPVNHIVFDETKRKDLETRIIDSLINSSGN
jgi:hypothetical protein